MRLVASKDYCTIVLRSKRNNCKKNLVKAMEACVGFTDDFLWNEGDPDPPHPPISYVDKCPVSNDPKEMASWVQKYSDLAKRYFCRHCMCVNWSSF